MRIGSLFAMALALAFCAALCGIFVWLVGRVGFMAAVVAGLAVLFVAYMVELEDGAAIGGSSTVSSPRSSRTRPEGRRIRRLAAPTGRGRATPLPSPSMSAPHS